MLSVDVEMRVHLDSPMVSILADNDISSCVTGKTEPFAYRRRRSARFNTDIRAASICELQHPLSTLAHIRLVNINDIISANSQRLLQALLRGAHDDYAGSAAQLRQDSRS